MRTFTVVSPPSKEAEAAVKKKQEEEAAPKGKQEEEATPTTITGGVSLDGTSVTVRSSGTALVKLNCLGIASCHGKLTLTAKSIVKGGSAKVKKARSVSIGTADFVIAGDETKTVKIDLDAAGRALLSVDHGQADARLAILELAPIPENTQVKVVRLLRQKADKTRKP